MLKLFIFAVVAAIVAVFVFAFTRPDTFRVQRQISIKAPAEKIFPMVSNFRQWRNWSPYEKLDPNMQRNYTGADGSKGAAYSWNGGGKAGAGRMEILDAPAPSKVLIQLDFTKPFNASNTAEFTLQPGGDSTTVTWAMYGPSPFISKLMGVFFNMDHMIGRDFETGLAQLKAAAEK